MSRSNSKTKSLAPATIFFLIISAIVFFIVGYFIPNIQPHWSGNIKLILWLGLYVVMFLLVWEYLRRFSIILTRQIAILSSFVSSFGFCGFFLRLFFIAVPTADSSSWLFLILALLMPVLGYTSVIFDKYGLLSDSLFEKQDKALKVKRKKSQSKR